MDRIEMRIPAKAPLNRFTGWFLSHALKVVPLWSDLSVLAAFGGAAPAVRESRGATHLFVGSAVLEKPYLTSLHRKKSSPPVRSGMRVLLLPRTLLLLLHV